MEEAKDERALLIAYKEAKQQRDNAEASLKTLQGRVYALEAQLIEAMNAKGAEATARYDGIGYAKLMKPRLYASFKKEDEDTIKSFLRQIGREDLIRETVHPSSLSAFVAESLEIGSELPDKITYYLKPQLRTF